MTSSRRTFDTTAFSQQVDVLNIVLENLTQGMVVVGPDYRVVAFNNYFENMFQFQPGTVLVGADFRGILKIWAEATGQDQQMLDHATMQLDEPNPFEFEFPQKINGEPRWCLLTHNPLPGKGFVRTFRDTTKRKHAEQALQESEATYRSLFDHMLNGLAYCRMEYENGQPKDFLYINVNDAFSNLTGLQNVTGRWVSEVIPGIREADPDLFEVYGRVARGGNPEHFETYLTALDMWFSVSVYSPQADHFVSVFDVITERKKAERSLKESNAYLENLINYANAPIIVWDPQFRITRFNRAFETLTGYIEADVLGQSLEILFPPDLAPRSMDLIRKTLTGERWEVVEIEILHMDKSVRTVLWNSATLFEADGTTPMATIAQGQDITERKQAEEALHKSAKSLKKAQQVAHVGSWTWNIKANRLEWSDEMYHIFGIAKDGFKGVLADVIAQAIHPDDRAAVEESNLSVTQQGIPVPLEYRVIWPDGTVRVVWAEAGEIIFDDAGAPAVLTGIVQDISERKQSEEDKAKLQAQLTHAQKMESLGTLAGGVAHDMNNVLGAILALASAHLSSLAKDNPLHPSLETIRDAATRGGDMVKRLLAFSRQSPSEKHQVNMNSLLLEEARLLERTTLAKVHLELKLAPDLHPILGDSSSLTHTIMNLCVNAVDAMGDGGTLTFRTLNLGRDQIEVTVEDNGSGMTKEVLDRAMDPFFTTKGVGKGTGLGLSLVFTTVKAHGGHLNIDSELGRGTRVLMTFPATAAQAQISAKEPPQRPGLDRQALQVLLVDDDDLIQKSTRMLIEVLGHTVTTAVSGEEALAALDQGLQPDVVVLDMNMPGLGGKGTLPRLRRMCPTVPVLLATGRADQEALDLVDAHPFVTLLSKPFSFEELRGHLHNVAGA